MCYCNNILPPKQWFSTFIVPQPTNLISSIENSKQMQYSCVHDVITHNLS